MFNLLIAHFINSRRQVADMLVAVVDISVMLRQQVHVVKDETVEQVMFQRLQDSGVVQPTFVEHAVSDLCSHRVRHSPCRHVYMHAHTQFNGHFSMRINDVHI